MLKAHNSKTAQIIKGFNTYCAMREKSKIEGIPFEQLLAENETDEVPKKKKKKILKYKAITDPGIEIKVKGVDGEVVNF